MSNTSLLKSFKELEGNPKICVYTEPLWGIPYFLFLPYATLYMQALGVTDTQIGVLLSIGMIVQVITALFSGAITDKLGRRRTTFYFDFLCWSVPCVLWALSQNYYWFLAAAIVNSTWRITANSWSLLLVEDAKKEKLVHIYTFIYIAGLVSAFFAPLAGIMVGRLGLVTAVRIMYIFAFVLMTIKFVILYVKGPETNQGRIRMEETKDDNIFSLLKGYGPVIKLMVHSRSTMICMFIMAIFGVVTMITNSYWPLLITGNFGIPEEMVAIFPFIRSSIMLFFFFFLVPKIRIEKFKIPLSVGFLLFAISQVIFFVVPEKGYVLLITSLLLEALALSAIRPIMDSLIVFAVDAHERARVMSIFWTTVLILTAPFGAIAGRLSEMSRLYPFALNIILILVGMVLAFILRVETTQTNVENDGNPA